MAGPRLIIVDADLPRRLAPELAKRDRPAFSTAEIGLSEFNDPQLLQELAVRFESRPWILITGDDAMPAEHGKTIVNTRATIATIHPERPVGITQDAWRRDIVHRWAHVFQTQADGDVRRYTNSGSRAWTARRRHIRAAAEGGWVTWPQARAGSREDGDRSVEPASPSAPPEPLPGFS
jgi:hypothetical protein